MMALFVQEIILLFFALGTVCQKVHFNARVGLMNVSLLL